MRTAITTRRLLAEAHTMKGVSPTVLWNLAPKFDQCLRQTEPVDLKPWEQEIRNHLITAKEPTFLAQHNLVRWGKRKGLV
jgi:hypothetical protein